MKYTYVVNGVDFIIEDGELQKTCVSADGTYNYIYNKKNGRFARWGKTADEDPNFSPIGPEILDLEISINGCPPINEQNCKFCYKGNSNAPATNMTFKTFKSVVDSFPKSLTQIALGLTGVQTNPDLIKMMEYCREIGIIPNFTLSGVDLTDEIAEKCSKLAGAIAVSAYKIDKNICYNTVKKLTDLGMEQINIHVLNSEESFDFVKEVVKDSLTDVRLSKLRAIVFLGVKPKGRAKDNYTTLSKEKYAELIFNCLRLEINFGFDSCSSEYFEKVIDDSKLSGGVKSKLKMMSESCESTLFSAYVNVNGDFFPCSFTEGEGEWIDGISISNVNFLKDVWFNKRVEKFRNGLIANSCNGCRKCPTFPEINIKDIK